jgi:hypothetical protein
MEKKNRKNSHTTPKRVIEKEMLPFPRFTIRTESTTRKKKKKGIKKRDEIFFTYPLA